MSLDLMRTQLATLFRLDAQGRMLYENEPGQPPAPRLFVGRTNTGNIWAVRHDLPTDLVATLNSICEAEPTATDFHTAPRYAAALRTLLGLGAPEWRGPAYVFPQQTPPNTVAILVAPEQRSLLAQHFPELLAEYTFRRPIAALIDQGVAVAACWCSRRSATAAEAGIESIPAVRQRGYALQVAMHWGAAIQAAGMTALYSTSWENLASQGVARKLGLYQYGEDWHIT